MIQTAVIAPGMAARVGLKALLEADPHINVVAEAASLAALKIKDLQADLIVLMVEPDAILAWDLANQANLWPAVLLLSDSPQHLQSLLAWPVPAWGVLPTDFSAGELVAAIYAIDAGLITITPAQFTSLERAPLPKNSSSQTQPPISLTSRELEVLTLLSDGLANKQISIELGISEHTVKFHVSSIYQKLNVSNRAEAVRQGIQLGLILI